jgi:putative SOS response-associated peptidase YedK
MCGRFSLSIPIPDLIRYFRLSKWLEYEKRYNIAPSQEIAVIRQTGDERELSMVHWGLVPHWAKDAKIGYKMINARAETLAAKPPFRDPFQHRRCIIPASGFYEWKKGARGREPYYLFRRDGAPLALAGLWERWENPANPGEGMESCVIVTTTANRVVAPLHHRMPAILEREEIDAWFSHHQHTKDLLALLRPAAEGVLDLYPVSEFVNRPGNEGEECVRPQDPAIQVPPGAG